MIVKGIGVNIKKRGKPWQESYRSRLEREKGLKEKKGKKKGKCVKKGESKREKRKRERKEKGQGCVSEGKRLKGKNRKGVGTRQWEQVPKCQDEKCQESQKGRILEKKAPHAGLEPATLSLEG